MCSRGAFFASQRNRQTGGVSPAMGIAKNCVPAAGIEPTSPPKCFQVERQDRMEAPCPLDHAGSVQPGHIFGLTVATARFCDGWAQAMCVFAWSAIDDFAPLRWLHAAFSNLQASMRIFACFASCSSTARHARTSHGNPAKAIVTAEWRSG